MQKNRIINKNKQGVAMFFVIFLMIVIGSFALAYFGMMREAQNTSHKFQKSEVARQLATAAADEAFIYVYNETGSIESDLFKQLVNRTDIIDLSDKNFSERNTVGYDISNKLSLTNSIADDMNISVKVRIIDFRNHDSKSSDNKYYKQEGVGTLEISVTVKPTSGDKKAGTCSIIRHHDYKVVDIVPKCDNNELRDMYANGYPLEYVLFLRKGVEEFESTRGQSLNPANKTLVIRAGFEDDKERLGKVYFGTRSDVGTQKGNHVFLNIDDSRIGMIPKNEDDSKLTKEYDKLNDSAIDGCASPKIDAILPTHASEIMKVAHDKAKEEDSDYDCKAWLTGKKLVIGYKRLPIATDTYSNFRNLTSYVENFSSDSSFDKTSLEYFDAGIRIEPASDSSGLDLLSNIIHGNVVQRFFNFGNFYLDLRDSTLTMQPYYDDKWHSAENDKVKDEDIKKALNEFTPIFYQNKWVKFHDHLQSVKNNSGSGGFNSELNELAKEKDRINYTTLEPYINSYDKKILSNLNREYPYVYGLKDDSKLKDNNPFKQPKLYTYRKIGGKTKVDNPAKVSAPYAHVNLWSRRQLKVDELYDLGIVENIDGKTVINLRGIIEIADNERLIIGDIDGKGIKPAGSNNIVYYRGCGVIIATNIYINTEISPCEDELYKGTPNVCVLATKGNPIIVDTDKKLEVSLISMVSAANANKIGNNGLNGMILATKKMNLHGSLAADWLGISLPFKSTMAWADATHTITYDPKLHPNVDIYQVNISRWTSFERILEQEDS